MSMLLLYVTWRWWLRENLAANDTSDIQVLKTYGAAPYATALKRLEKQINEKQASVNEKIGIKVLSSVDLSPVRSSVG